MKKFRNFKVGTKLIIESMAILTIILAAAFLVVIMITNNSTKTSGSDHLNTIAEKNANMVAAKLEESLTTARDISEGFQGLEEVYPEYRRDYYNNYLKSFLHDNNQLLGVWTCWEPNTFDELDSSYKNKKGSDASGRFIPHYSRSEGKISLSPLSDYDVEGDGDYYLLAKNSGQETILDPYQCEIDGKTILATTIAVPIKNADGEVLGVAGIEFPLNDYINLEFDNGNYESSYSFIISNNATTVTHPKSESVGTNLKDLNVTGKDNIIASIKKGQSIKVVSNSLITGNKVDLVFTPVKIGNTTTPWSVGIAIEMEEYMAAATQIMTVLIIAFAAILIAIIGVMFLITRLSISKPLKATAGLAKHLASGNLDEKVTIKTMDEIGQLAKILDQDVRKAFKNIEQARVIADKQSQYQAEQVDKLVVNLERLANGELFCDMAVSEPDDDTRDIYEMFSNISVNLHKSTIAIRGYIDEISYTLNEIASGNLVVEITSEYQGDFVELKNSINAIVESFNNMMLNISTAAEQVASGTIQVADGSQEISQGATEQASAIEELSSSITQMAEQIKQNAANASTSAHIVAEARDAANDGNEKMQRMLQSMDDINDASSSISKIIKVIDDIAFQTNILALNAAVEAARAGVHGKGFAVVAEEVRNLAARSANAANETTAMIEGSIKKVENGTKIANETAGALSTIVTGSEESAELLNQIAVASNEQATGIAQINKGIEQLSQVVQTNSATSEQTAAASEELSSQAEMLKSTIAEFKLKNDVSDDIEETSEPDPSDNAEEEDDPEDVRPNIILNDDEFGKY